MFFQELKAQTLINLNNLFYEASFSDSPPLQAQPNHYHIHNGAACLQGNTANPRQSLSHLSQTEPIVLSSSMPPLSLSSE
jgi:hypothetical protein